MTRIGLVGAGWHGQGQLNTLVKMENVQVVGVCDLDAERATKAAAKHGLQPYSDVTRMFDEARPEALVIVTPPEARLELVSAAAQRKIHCFIEKPPAKDIASAKAVQAVLAESGIIHSVGFMYRYSRAVDRCRELVAGRRVALVRSAMLDGIALRPNWPRWFFDKARSGGPILDQAIHMFDLCRYILGEATDVAGFQGNPIIPKGHDFTIEESATLTLRWENGSMQTHVHSWAYPTYTSQVELISDELHLTLDLAAGSLSGRVGAEEVRFVYEDPLYRMELEAFLTAVREGRQELIRSTYADSISSLALTLAATAALEEGRVTRVGQ